MSKHLHEGKEVMLQKKYKWKVGDSAEISKVVTEESINQFAEISGDYNAIHVDKDYAESSIFGNRIAHGLFCLSMISYLIGMELPGDGAIFLNEALTYKAPACLGDEIKTTVRVAEINYEKQRMLLEIICENQNGTVCLDGTTLVKVL